MNAERPSRRRIWLWGVAVVFVILVLTPSYLRAYRVGGPSDAPTYLSTDLVLVNKLAYDLRLPYTDIVLLSHSDPERGDVVLYRVPDDTHTVFKRIVGCPGDTVEMVGNHLIINKTPLKYEILNAADYADIGASHGLGSMVEMEKGLGPEHTVSHSGDASRAPSFGPVVVSPGHFFVLGDNRDNSLDSRAYGAISRDTIIGRLGRPLGRASR